MRRGTPPHAPGVDVVCDAEQRASRELEVLREAMQQLPAAVEELVATAPPSGVRRDTHTLLHTTHLHKDGRDMAATQWRRVAQPLPKPVSEAQPVFSYQHTKALHALAM